MSARRRERLAAENDSGTLQPALFDGGCDAIVGASHVAHGRKAAEEHAPQQVSRARGDVSGRPLSHCRDVRGYGIDVHVGVDESRHERPALKPDFPHRLPPGRLELRATNGADDTVAEQNGSPRSNLAGFCVEQSCVAKEDGLRRHGTAQGQIAARQVDMIVKQVRGRFSLESLDIGDQASEVASAAMTSSGRIGTRLIDFPIASATALPIAAATGTMGGSATPLPPKGPAGSPCSRRIASNTATSTASGSRYVSSVRCTYLESTISSPS